MPPTPKFSMEAWLGGLVPAELAASLLDQGITKPALLCEISPSDWKEIPGALIGHRHVLVNAARKLEPMQVATELRAECERRIAELTRRKAKVATLESDLAVIESQIHDLEAQIKVQRALIQAARADPNKARLINAEKAVQEARAANDEIKRDISAARADTVVALETKERIINGVVTTQRTTTTLNSISLPSLSPTLAPKQKKSKEVKDKWANLDETPWYFGDMPREQCTERLLLPGVGPGYFLVRKGPSDENPFQLSFRGFGEGPDSVRHVRITMNPANGKLKLARRKPDSFEATNISDLIGYYMNMDVGEGITLSEPAPKPKPVRASKAILPSELGLP